METCPKCNNNLLEPVETDSGDYVCLSCYTSLCDYTYDSMMDGLANEN